MPWKNTSALEERSRFVLLVERDLNSFAECCRRFGVSRKTGYLWWKRFRRGGLRALVSRSHKPHRCPARWPQRWKERLRACRRAHRTWGAPKVQARWRVVYRRARLPAVRTIGRWLQQLGLSGARRLRARRGPALPAPPLTVPTACNQVWTLDFKGHFRTADGQLCYPLTVRDLHSRFVLAIIGLSQPSEKTVRKALRRVFRRWGLPQIFRVDNGAPFGSCGPRGLTTLSVWWLRLGVGVEFTGRARPQDNAAHEQMHRVLKAETASPPGATAAAQQRRFERWIRCYNYVRPHQSLDQKPPATCYRRSRQPWPEPLADWSYDKAWPRRRVHSKGFLIWQGRRRNVGRAFVGEWLALKPLCLGVWQVYLGKHPLGTLHATDAAGLRPVRLLAHRKKC